MKIKQSIMEIIFGAPVSLMKQKMQNIAVQHEKVVAAFKEENSVFFIYRTSFLMKGRKLIHISLIDSGVLQFRY